MPGSADAGEGIGGSADTLKKLTTTGIGCGVITDCNINANAAIAVSKLEAIASAKIIVGNACSVASLVSVSGDITISNTGVIAIGSDKVTDTMISSHTTSKIIVPLATQVSGLLPLVNIATPPEACATADQTGAEIKSAYELEVNAFTDTQFTKLAGIEVLADVTDATNVDLAGALMLSDTTTSGLGIVIDEDNMASDLDTRVPTQQSVKAYVDTEIGTALTSDITLKGDYNASTNSPDLDTTPSGIVKGDHYVTSVAGTFFTIPLEVGDSIISKQDTPTLESHWIVAQANLTPSTIKTQYESNANTNAVTDAEKTVIGNTSGTNTGDEVAASTTVEGVSELATIAEVDTGTDAVRTITPAGLAGSALQTKVDGITAGANALTSNSLSQFAATSSAQLAGVLSDETGTDKVVFSTSPTLVTPILGTPTSGVATNITGLPLTGLVATTINRALVSNGSGVVSPATTTDTEIGYVNGVTSAIQTQLNAKGTGDALVANPLSQFAATSSAQLAGVISDETGSGLLVFGTSPTLVTPALGTPSALTLTSATGLPITGITSSTSAQLATLISDETGSGALVFGTSPTLTTPILGTITSGDGSALTGTAASFTAGNVTTNANLTGHITSTGNASILGSFTKAQLDTAVSDASMAILGANTFTGAQDMGGFDVNNIQNLVHNLTTTATVSGAQTLDFNADQLETWALSGATAITFNTTSNKAVGRSKTIRLVNDATLQNITLNASWKVVGTVPTDIAASKTAILTLTCFGTAEADIVAAYAVEA